MDLPYVRDRTLKRTPFRARLFCVFGVIGIAFLSGCASPQMKGTPFFTGEYAVRQGPPEDRVNLWPLLYDRDPALSVLWPLAEITDNHLRRGIPCFTS